MHITTDRLTIRSFTPADLDAVCRVYDSAFGAAPRHERESWLTWTIASEAEYARLYQPPYGERAVVLNESGAVVGSVGLVPSLMPFGQLTWFSTRLGLPVERRATPEVGLFWALDAVQRGQGYASEAARALCAWAFATFDLARLVATTEYDNRASQAVMRRLGMVVERNPFDAPHWMQVVGILEQRTGG